MAKLSKENEQYLERYLTLNMGRDRELLTTFLPSGYQQTTLNSVADSKQHCVQSLKWQLGLLITLTDDFCDHPTFRNLQWSKCFIANTFVKTDAMDMKDHEKKALNLATDLYATIKQSLLTLSIQPRIQELTLFDLQQYLTSMVFSTLINDDPILFSKREYLWYAPHNMGMLIAGMMDLCFSETLHWSEMARCRELFYSAQRYGHICNTLTTLQRERAENCIGNEVSLKLFHGNNGTERTIFSNLNEERLQLKSQLKKISIRTFSTQHYIKGIESLQSLHESMEGVI